MCSAEDSMERMCPVPWQRGQAMWLVSPWVQKTATLSVVTVAFLCVCGIVYGVCRILEAKKIYIRV